MTADPGAQSAPVELSVVIPVYNEPEWIGRTVAALETAIERSRFAGASELVIVDDGSAEPTRDALDRLATRAPLRIVRQENRGRFLARKAGIEAARGELVMLVDARVTLDADALRWVGEQIAPGSRVWNGHCMIDTSNPYARFWDVITHAGLQDYLANPRTTSFGPEEYDRFPKGTSHFLAPREHLLYALDAFTTYFEDLRDASDDTELLRHVVERERIHISPHFASVYHSRTNLRGFMRHAHHRGKHFFDGFGRPGRRFFWVVVAVFPATVIGIWLVVRAPLVAAACLLAIPLVAGAVALRIRRPARDALAFAALAPVFGVVYVAGIWRGAALALRARLRRRDRR